VTNIQIADETFVAEDLDLLPEFAKFGLVHTLPG
jgi:hypothetical protein